MRFAASVLVIAGLGCSLFSSLDDFAAEDPVPTVDGGEAGAQADGSSPSDGDAPPADTGLDATRSFCETAGPVAFCSDFDKTTTLTEGWSRFRSFGDGGVGTLDLLKPSSPPRAALLEVVPNGAPCTFAQLERVLPGTFGAATLSFDTHVDLAPEDSPVLAALEIAEKCSIVIGPYGNDPRLRRQDDPQGVSGAQWALARTVRRAEYERVTITLAVDGRTPAIRALFGSEVVLEQPTVPATCNVKGNVYVIVGPHCIVSTPRRIGARFDNVTATAE